MFGNIFLLDIQTQVERIDKDEFYDKELFVLNTDEAYVVAANEQDSDCDIKVRFADKEGNISESFSVAEYLGKQHAYSKIAGIYKILENAYINTKLGKKIKRLNFKIHGNIKALEKTENKDDLGCFLYDGIGLVYFNIDGKILWITYDNNFY